MSEEDDDAALQAAFSGRHHSLKCTNILYFHSQYNKLQIIHVINLLNLKIVVVHNEAVNMPKGLYIIALDDDISRQ